MTIYSIVNNLILCLPDSGKECVVWTLVSPAGILQGGNPFFVPDFAGCFEARIALAVRIGKLGKGIAPRFACRYVDAVAPSVLFVASDLLADLQARGLPWTSAVSYDKCVAIGKFINIPFEEIKNIKINLLIQSPDMESSYEWTSALAYPGLEKSISCLSRDNTLKTGDIILFGLSPTGPRVHPGLRTNLTLNGDVSLKFNIR